MRPSGRLWFASLLLALVPLCAGAQYRLTAGTDVTFASAEQGRAIIGQPDEYFIRMGAFDRMLRLRTGNDAGSAEHRAVLLRSVTDWPAEDEERIASVIDALATALNGMKLPLPPRVWMVRTTGMGELGDAYTRADAIVLPAHSIGAARDVLLKLLAHELFHVMTRHDSRFRERAYRTIGFRMSEHVELPASLAARRLTNPDAFRNDAYIELSVGGKTLLAIPVLLSRSEKYDPRIGTGLTDYWMMRLMKVEPVEGTQRLKPVLEDGEPVLLQASKVEGFFEQIGTNTRYIVHPEEILADHFALMVTGARVPEPVFVDRLRALLKEP